MRPPPEGVYHGIAASRLNWCWGGAAPRVQAPSEPSPPVNHSIAALRLTEAGSAMPPYKEAVN